MERIENRYSAPLGLHTLKYHFMFSDIPKIFYIELFIIIYYHFDLWIPVL